MNNEEVRIYGEDGFRIPRHGADVGEDSQRFAVLINLSEIGDLFTGGFTHNEFDDTPTTHAIYPQAFTRSYGHFQANGIVEAFRPILAKVNQELGINPNDDQDDDEDGNLFGDDDDDLFGDRHHHHHAQPPIRGIACQGYNEVVHRVRSGGAKYHDAQLGVVTATLAGSFSTTDQGKQAQASLRRKIEHLLPHKKFAAKIVDFDNLNLDIRLENVFEIDMKRFKPQRRCGR
jgi:hypothetical protein